MASPRSGRPAAPTLTVRAVAPRHVETVDSGLGRIALLLDAARVEVYSVRAAHVVLHSAWSAPHRRRSLDARADLDVDLTVEDAIDAAWFPWGLGNIKPREYVFVRNAGSLPARADGSSSLGDASIGSSLHVPLVVSGRLRGAVCALWTTERDDWPVDRLTDLQELARSVLELDA